MVTLNDPEVVRGPGGERAASDEHARSQGGPRGVNSDLSGADRPLLDEADRKRILYEWNDTSAQYPTVCAHQLFEQQVDRSADAVALIFKARRLTYRELNERANQVAHFLRKNGVGPETLVGVSLERSPELVIGLLGVWKAGAAYVPLDPAYPPERLSFMVGDAAIRILLTERKCKDLFSSAGATAVCLDDDWPTIAKESMVNPSVNALPSGLAYVMYTSGSTGQPKGAMILHAGLVNYLCWAIDTYGVEPGESVPVHSSIAFDLTVTSLYPALLAGGQVELLVEDVGAQNLLAALRERKNRCLVKITPAHLDVLTQQLRPEELAGLTKVFVIGGENLPAESLSPWRDFAPDLRLINEYGPTETVVGCCVYEVQPGDPRNGPVPIGRPISNTQLYILDEELNPVPVGAMGELFVGGAGVARGYLNRPELTQTRFLPDPFSGRPGARLYRTGDLARYRADGTLEFLGRVDNQVKVRGYRIELGEIEAIMASHPVVQSCVVLAREDTPGNKQLVGYVVTREGQKLATNEMQAFLKGHLPEYMVPAQIVWLESLPLTLNGKVDRNALPSPSSVSSAAPKSFIAPRNEMETSVGSIWAELLKVDSVGVDDDFFELGGHSLLAIRTLVRIRDLIGVDLPPQTLFENSTLAAFAAIVREAKGDQKEKPTTGESAEAPPARHFSPDDPIVVRLREGAPERPPLWCVFGVTIYQELARALAGDYPVIGVHVPNRYVPGRDPQPSITQMAQRYVTLIRRQQEHGPYHLLGLCFGGIVAYEIARQLQALGEQIAMVTVLDAILPTARKVDHVGRLRAYARQAWDDPRQIPRWLVKNREKLIARVPGLDTLLSSFAAAAQSPELIDLAVNGTRVDSAFARFASQPTRLAATLLVVRATAETIAGWMQIKPDQGWTVFADRVVIHDIPALHLQVLQEPHVRSLAAAINAESHGPGRSPSV